MKASPPLPQTPTPHSNNVFTQIVLTKWRGGSNCIILNYFNPSKVQSHLRIFLWLHCNDKMPLYQIWVWVKHQHSNSNVIKFLVYHMLQNSSYDNSMPIQNIFFPSNVQNGLIDRMPGRDSPSLYNQFFADFSLEKYQLKTNIAEF